MDTFLLSNASSQYVLQNFPGIDKEAILQYMKKRKRKLRSRALSPKEINTIREMLNNNMTFESIAELLCCRSGKELEKLWQEIK